MDTQRTRGTVRKKVMYDARLFLTFLFMVVSLAGATTSIAAEDTSPPLATSHEVNVAWQVATALAVGSDAVRNLRGPPIENSNLDRLDLPIYWVRVFRWKRF